MTSPGDAASTSAPRQAQVEVLLIGGGNMGSALLEGMIGSGEFAAADLGVVEVVEARRAELAAMFPGVTVSADLVPCRSAIIAVKPKDVTAAATGARDAGATRVLSIAAGVRIDTLQFAVGPDVAVVRAMPNTPALVGRGAAAIAGGATADAADVDWAARILGSVGTVDELPEALLDAFTGVAGSGPAYLFLVAEALIDAAVAEGIERPVAERVVRQLLVGSAMLLDRELDPVRLRAQVTSPGGTTAAGIAVFEEHDLRGTVAAAVAAATARSRELA